MTVTINGTDFNHIIDVVTKKASVVSLPEWINDSTPDIDTNVWNRKPYWIIYTLRVTNALKWILDQLLTGHTQVTLSDTIEGISGSYWVQSIEASWRGDKNWTNPWLITMELLTEAVIVVEYQIWVDLDDDGIAETYWGPISPYTGSESAIANYNYFSDSGHPINGPTPIAYESKLWLYKTSNQLYLFIIHNSEGDGTITEADFTIVCVDMYGDDADIIVEDDAHENEMQESPTNTFTCDWHNNDNTDGGVIGPFNPIKSWTIKITPDVNGWLNTNTWDVYSVGDQAIHLNMNHAVHIKSNFTILGSPTYNVISILKCGLGGNSNAVTVNKTSKCAKGSESTKTA